MMSRDLLNRTCYLLIIEALDSFDRKLSRFTFKRNLNCSLFLRSPSTRFVTYTQNSSRNFIDF